VDYRALAELVLMGLLGLSAFVLAVGFSVRAFLAPTLREVFERLGKPHEGDGMVGSRLDQMDERLTCIEQSLEKLETAQRFDRQLERPRE
jgi:hypothetical protein